MKYTVHLVVLDYFRNIVGSSNVTKNFRSCSRTIQSRSISSATFEWSSKLMDDVDSMGPDLQPVVVRFSNFLLGKISLQFILHGMSIFHDIQMATYFGTAWSYSHMVGYAGSPTRTVYDGVTLTRSKVKVNLSGLLNFRQLAKPCMLAAMTAAPLRGFLVFHLFHYFIVQPIQDCCKLSPIQFTPPDQKRNSRWRSYAKRWAIS